MFPSQQENLLATKKTPYFRYWQLSATKHRLGLYQKHCQLHSQIPTSLKKIEHKNLVIE